MHRLAAVAVRAEFGPTLPALLRSRGVSTRAQLAALALLAALVAAAVAIARAGAAERQLVIDGPPRFNVVYRHDALRPVAARPGELLRLAGRRPGVAVTVTVRPVVLAPFAGDVVGAVLPVHAEARERDLAARYGPLQIFDEGKARTGGAPGYQIGFAASPGGRRLLARDVYALPDVPGARAGVLLSLRQWLPARLTAADKAFLDECRQAFRSFAFGSDRPAL